MIKILLENPVAAQVDVTCPEFKKGLQILFEKGSPELLTFLNKQGKLDLKANDIHDAIMLAMKQANTGVVGWLIDHYLENNIPNKNQRNILMAEYLLRAFPDDAVSRSKIKPVVQFFIDQGADLNLVHEKLGTPLYYAAYCYERLASGRLNIDVLYNAGATGLPDFSKFNIPDYFPHSSSILRVNANEKDIGKCITMMESGLTRGDSSIMPNIVFNIGMMHAIEHARRLLVQGGNDKKAAAFSDLLQRISHRLNQPFTQLIDDWKTRLNSTHTGQTNAELISDHKIAINSVVADIEKRTGVFSSIMSVFSDTNSTTFQDIGATKTEKFINQLCAFSNLHQSKMQKPKQQNDSEETPPPRSRPG